MSFIRKAARAAGALVLSLAAALPAAAQGVAPVAQAFLGLGQTLDD